MYYLSIDATNSVQIGRIVNDAPTKYANCVMKKYTNNKMEVFIALYALVDIKQDTELRYIFHSCFDVLTALCVVKVEVLLLLLPGIPIKILMNCLPMSTVSAF